LLTLTIVEDKQTFILFMSTPELNSTARLMFRSDMCFVNVNWTVKWTGRF